MADDLELRMRSIGGEGPSPEFVATLRERVLAEAAMRRRPAPQDTNDPTMEDIMLSPERNDSPTTSRRWTMIAAAVAALALVGGLVYAGTRADEDPAPADQPVPPTPTEPESESEAAPPVDLVAARGSLPDDLAILEPDVPYETDLLGVPMTFSTSRTMRLVYALPGEIWMKSIRGSVVQAKFVRLGGWNTGTEARDPEFREVGSIAPDDIDGWIADNEVIATPLPDVDVGGRAARVFDIEVDPASTADEACPSGSFDSWKPCIWYYSVSPGSFDPTTARDNIDRSLDSATETRLWLVAIDGFDPILLEARIPQNTNDDWLDEFAETTLATLELGPPAPALDVNGSPGQTSN